MGKFKVLVAFKSNKAGDIVELDEADGLALSKAGMVEKVVASDELGQLEKSISSKIEEAADKAVKAALKMVEKSVKGANIVVGQSEEDKILDGAYGKEDLGKFLLDVHAKAVRPDRVSDRFDRYIGAVSKAAAGQNETTNADGGYLVPTQVGSLIAEKPSEGEIVRPRALVLPMTGKTFTAPELLDYDRSVGVGGVAAPTATAEGASLPAEDVLQFGQISLTARKYVTTMAATEEMLEDSAALGALMARVVPQRFADLCDDKFLFGTGTTEALGALHANNPALLEVGESGTADRMSPENLAAMYAGCRNRLNAVWVISDVCIPYLLTMKMADGAPVWLQNANLAGAPQGTILGRPVLFSDKMQPYGTVGDIALVDFSQYIVGERGGLKAQSSIHVYWSTDDTAFRWIKRFDGTPGWTDTMTQKNGATVSPFVVLGLGS